MRLTDLLQSVRPRDSNRGVKLRQRDWPRKDDDSEQRHRRDYPMLIRSRDGRRFCPPNKHEGDGEKQSEKKKDPAKKKYGVIACLAQHLRLRCGRIWNWPDVGDLPRAPQEKD